MAEREKCEGEGMVVSDTHFGNTICPVCRAIAQVDKDGKVEPHTVLVILGDD